MSNPEIAKFYLNKSPVTVKSAEVNEKNILSFLNETFENDWAYEITDEKLLIDSTMVSTTVMLYIPGRVCTGRSLSKVADYGGNALKALVEASKMITGAVVSNVKSEEKKENGQDRTVRTAQAITDDIINTLRQVSEPEEKPEEKTEEIDLSEKEPISESESADDHMDIPEKYRGRNAEFYKVQKNGYTRCQQERYKDFKIKWDIANDDMLANYIRQWKPELPDYTPSVVFNPQNMDEFLAWGDSLEERRC